MWLDIVAKWETLHHNISTFPYKQTGLIENHTLKFGVSLIFLLKVYKFWFGPLMLAIILIRSPSIHASANVSIKWHQSSKPSFGYQNYVVLSFIKSHQHTFY